MKKRTLALLLAMVMVLTCVMAGCGGNGNSSASSAAPASSGAESTPVSSAVESTPSEPAETGEMTEVGTPRNQTLIVEHQSPTDAPGQFNTYMSGTQAGGGIHQMLSSHLWEMDTVKGEQFGEIAESWEANTDWTEWTVKVREGIKWSDGEDLTADDVAYTFNMIMDNDAINQSSYAKQVFKSVEATDDYTVKFTMNESFPRLTSRFGVTIWGTDYRIVPEHIYSQQADVTTFKDENPVAAGPYTVKETDSLGKWTLYELREDWMQSTLGVAGGAVYGYTEADAPPKYVWFRNIGGDAATRQMAMINNEMDVLMEVTPEMVEAMQAQNPNISCWYKDYPYATSDDPCSKGLVFSQGKGAPYNDPNFRWGMTLLLDIDQISMNVFDGVGRISAIPVLTATTAMTELYYKPMQEWLENFELDLGNGEKFKPFDTTYKDRMAEALRAQGRDIPDDEETLIDMFGIGWWKHDEAAAEKLLNKAGLTKENGKWMYNGEPFKFTMTYLAEQEQQAGRGVQAAFNQWQAAGFDCTLASESSSTWDTNGGTGSFDIAGYWPTGGITRDLYTAISGYDNDLYTPMGETGSGQGMRWENAEASDLIHQLAKVSPDSDESYEICTEWLKKAVEDCAMITFHAGVKFVPTNSTYWTGYPCADDPYNGPWWWWSTFKYILPHLKAAQ